MEQPENILNEHDLFEVMGHARGGQGMVTAFEILAKIFSHSGIYEVQAFPSFGVERTGAPIQGFLRISANTILNRSNIYAPNLIVVFDESLIGQVPVFDGLRENGILLLNTSNKPEMFKDKAALIYTVPATKISLEKKLGSRSLPIVNSAMIGALLKILGGDIEIAKEIIKAEVPTKPEQNAEAAEIAFNSLNVYVNPEQFIPAKTNGAGAKTDVTTTPFWNKPMSLNKTGNWRLSIPIYVNREAPCTGNCPAGIDVRGFIKLAADYKFDEAYDLIYDRNPFPSLCGRECPGYCEQHCNREDYDGSLNISGIERFIGDRGLMKKIVPKDYKYEDRIAVLGSGAACLTAAVRLRRAGYDVSVFEPTSEPGGLMREFYTEKEILDKEISRIVDEGVEIVLGRRLCVDEVPSEFAAVITSEFYPGHSNHVNDEKERTRNPQGVPVFYSATGDCEKGFVEAIGRGNEIARLLHAFLKKEKYAPLTVSDDLVKSGEMKFHYYDTAPRNKKMGYTFSEIMEGTVESDVAGESSRCMHCGTCFNCGNCYNFCPDALVHFDNKDRLRINYDYCKGCGICYYECPSSAMKFDIIKKAKQ